MSWKLEKGRELLRQRLARRGVALGAGTLLTMLTESAATAAVPPALFESTHQAITLLLAGQGTAGLLSTNAATLADSMIQALVWSKIKVAAACVLALGLLAIGSGMLIDAGQGRKHRQSRCRSRPIPSWHNSNG